jgi:hypothetical protein
MNGNGDDGQTRDVNNGPDDVICIVWALGMFFLSIDFLNLLII